MGATKAQALNLGHILPLPGSFATFALFCESGQLARTHEKLQ
jgi:hypothetical protein